MKIPTAWVPMKSRLWSRSACRRVDDKRLCCIKRSSEGQKASLNIMVSIFFTMDFMEGSDSMFS